MVYEGRGGYSRDSRGPSRDYAPREQRPQAPVITTKTPCDVVVNMHKYTGKDIMLHQYLVTFEPAVLVKVAFEKFMTMVEKNNFTEHFAFDGVNMLVSTKKFQDTTLTLPMRDGEMKCKIEYKNSYDMADKSSQNVHTLIQCMETVFRFYQRQVFAVDRRKMFNAKSEATEIGTGLCVIPGLTSTFRLNKSGFYLNLDVAFGVFYKPQRLIEALTELASNRRYGGDPLRDDLGADFYNDFEKFIKNIRLTTTHRERNSTFKASGVLCKPASSVEFEVDGKVTTVAKYFAEAYKPLQYPHLPLIVVKKKAMTIYIPIEVLKIVPMQKYPKKLNEFMTSQMIKIAAKRPYDRFSEIKRKSQELVALNNENLKRFGMAFDSNMLNCKGTILPPPAVTFAGNRKVTVNNGSWNLIGVQAQSGVEIEDWSVFAFRKQDTPANLSMFRDLASKYGVEFRSQPKIVVVRNMQEFFDAPKSNFNLVVLLDKNAQRYEELKRVAETYCGCYTQCMQAANLQKLSNASFVANLLLKINCKLGGKNWALENSLFNDKPTILFGIDVNHPGVADLESPSIVSVVASMDYGFVNYKTAIEQQGRREEIVGNLKSIVKGMLKSHFGNTKAKPARLVIFRDGVGDSMFDAVFKCEIDAIREACNELEAGYNPELNFIVAQKRHSVRFSVDGKNAVPGTVVDEIGHPGCFDFYLVSHNALQGTARPVRYLVLLNESKFSPSVMYDFVYGLCHLYARATKAVSVVPPIYYAHLAAARGKCYLERNDDGAVVMKQCKASVQKTLYYV